MDYRISGDQEMEFNKPTTIIPDRDINRIKRILGESPRPNSTYRVTTLGKILEGTYTSDREGLLLNVGMEYRPNGQEIGQFLKRLVRYSDIVDIFPV